MTRSKIFLISVLVVLIVSGCTKSIKLSRLPPVAAQDAAAPTNRSVAPQLQPEMAAVITQTMPSTPLAAQNASVSANHPIEAQSQPATAEAMPQSIEQPVAATVDPIAAVSTGCPTEHFLDVSTYTQGSIQPQLNVTCTADTVIVESNGIPNFEFVQITPNVLQSQSHHWQFPLHPTMADTPADIPLLGPIGVAVNGLPIYGPNEAPNQDYGDPYLDQILDYCNGHTGPRGDYHFHARPDCLFEDMEGNVSLVIAYAFDGYPILAPYICVDAVCSQTKEVQSSWQRTSNVRNAWDAHEYIAGSGDLDQCNGMIGPDGSYRYYATDTFPYFLGCYRGQATVMPGPGGNGPDPTLPADGNQPAGGGQPGVNPPANGSGQPPGPPPGQPGQGPDLAAAAAQLGVSESDLRAALGPPPPDLVAAAAQLDVSEADLRAALGPPPGRAGN
ncbi:MAG: YHYH protein [Anaerolineae bacterium]|nr:YHYH protein [Anaerolineae bacterium]